LLRNWDVNRVRSATEAQTAITRPGAGEHLATLSDYWRRSREVFSILGHDASPTSRDLWYFSK